MALDTLKSAVAGVADMMDRQLVLLCLPAMNGGLPEVLCMHTAASSVTPHERLFAHLLLMIVHLFRPPPNLFYALFYARFVDSLAVVFAAVSS